MWLSRAYGMAIAVTLVLKIAALIRLRTTRHEPRPFSAPVNLRWGNREIPVGLIFAGSVIGLSALALLASADIPSIAVLGLIGGVTVAIGAKRVEAESPVAEEEPFEILTSPDVSLGQVEVRPGNVLVGVRHPHSLAHVVAALQEAGDRDVVVVTVRLLGVDDDETGGGAASTREETISFPELRR